MNSSWTKSSEGVSTREALMGPMMPTSSTGRVELALTSLLTLPLKKEEESE